MNKIKLNKGCGGGGGRGKKKVVNSPLGSQQKKITQFFKKNLPETNGSGDNNSQSEISPYFVPKTIPTRNSAVEERIKCVLKGSKPATNVNEVIVLSDSDSETESKKGENRTTILESSMKTVEVTRAPDSNVRLENSNYHPAQNCTETTTLSTKNENGNTSQKGDGHMTPETDSEEELLSQLDVEEIISSQEKQRNEAPTDLEGRVSRTPTKVSRGLNSKGMLSPSRKRTPTKSPKAKINKFSPLLPLKKRSRSGSQSSNSPSPHRKISPSVKNGPQPNQRQSPVKKLNFFSPTPIPYYLKNFSLVIDSVVHDEHNTYLLNEDDWKTVDTFNALSLQSRCLYVRLFQRKWEWKVASTIKYPIIADNLLPYFEELHSKGFLMEIMDDVPELETLLDLLSGDQITVLSKQMKVDPSKKNKQLCKMALMKTTKKQQTLCGSSSSIIVKSALKLLGKTYQLERQKKELISRLFILYCPPTYWEDEQDQTANHLLKMLMNERGDMEYPDYTINKTTRIYSDRECLVRFHEAWALHCDISAYLESKNWDDVIEIAEESILQLKQILDDENGKTHDINLPTFLRVYTAGSVLTRVAWLGVDGFQKVKNYARSNEIIEFILSQTIYLPHYRGRWYERLIINLQHLKSPAVKIKRVLEKALSDPLVPNSSKLTLSDRLEKLNEKATKAQQKKSKSKKKSKDDELIESEDEEDLAIDDSCLFRLTHETPSRTIQGEKMDYGSSGRKTGKSVFIGAKDSSGSSTASSVEQFAIEYYKTLGFKYGLHAEGSAVTSIYGLIFWEEIYNDQISDSFYAPYQAFPLDIHFEDFYTRREGILTLKLENMRNAWSLEDVLEMMENNWEVYFNKLSVVNWSVFPSVDYAKTLVKALGLQVTAAICERLSSNFRHYRSGFPDLVVWNDDQCIFVEVKGPGDSLSAKQMLWIDYLLSIGAKAEVCHVVAVSNKRIKM